MNTSQRIEVAKLEIAARLEIDAARLAQLLAATRRGGWSGVLDHLAGVLAWAGAPRDPRGRPAVDAMVANVMANCPRRAGSRAALTRAAILKAGGWRGQHRRRDRRGGRRAGAGRKPRGGGAAGAAA